MILIDTHTHLYDEQFDNDRATAITAAINAGVQKMYMPNCDSGTISEMLAIEETWKGHCFAMMGLHPVYVKENYLKELEIVRSWLSRRQFAAIGEIGIDKYWDISFLEAQKEAFATQVDWALEYDLPIVIHSREATADCIEIVKEQQKGKLRGVFHCFSGTIEEATQIAELGLMLGIGGVVTFKKTNLGDIINAVGLQHIVLETDAPYLAPVPHRGKRNESSYIPIISEKVASLLGTTPQQVAAATTANAENLFSASK